MLNLQRLAHGGEAYYLDQVVSGVEDYYGEAGEAPGYWLASSQDLMGLDGTIDAAALRSVLSGVDPFSGERFHSARNRRVPGWDLTFRAPKSVSVLWALGEPDVAVEVSLAHDVAVARAMVYMEDKACWTRTGRNGVHRVPGDGFVAAGFRHRTSRDRDPLLHTHVLVANSVRAEDGKWRTIDAKGLYDHARTGGFIYQVELRHELTRRLGVSWSPVGNGLADIDGVDPGVIRLYSKRREWIEERMAEWGVTSAKGAQVATLDTRHAKSDRGESFGEQRARWRDEAITAGHHPVNLEVVSSDHEMPDVDADVSTAAFRLLSSPEGLTRRDSTFDRRGVVQALAHALPAGVTADEIEHLTDLYLDRGEVVRVGHDDRTGDRFTTQDLWDLEKQLVGLVASGRMVGRANRSHVDAAIRARPSISSEQADAVREMCGSRRPVDVMIAAAGTGKTFSLDAARDAWQRSGYTVIGCALAAAAAQQLETGSGIPSTTLTSLTGFLDSGQVQLHDQVVVVVDEAAMVATRDIAPLLTRAAAARAKLVLVGDPKQLPEIGAGGLLAHLDSRRRVITLTENRRQHDPIERQALAELRAGDVDRAVDLLRERGGIVHGPNSEVVRDGMVGDWWTHREAGGDALMLARRNSDVDDLNRRARNLMAVNGRLSGDVIVIAGRPFQIGDQVVCLRNDYRTDVRNGTTGTITAINHHKRSSPSTSTPTTGHAGSNTATSTPAISGTATPSPSTKPKAAPPITASSSAPTTSPENPDTSDSHAAASRTGSTSSRSTTTTTSNATPAPMTEPTPATSSSTASTIPAESNSPSTPAQATTSAGDQQRSVWPATHRAGGTANGLHCSFGDLMSGDADLDLSRSAPNIPDRTRLDSIGLQQAHYAAFSREP